MSRYELLRQFADSWALLGMCLLFLGFVGWTFRPGARRHHDEAAKLIFRSDSDD
ncbi:cbb3-type cytochrome c oxidase subunit 3 [Sandarakinorhabdus sp.]|jgi:cytochrome c oxidase cbb3-type subunit 4|uniref:cbb3-type cytochrome c oxidase subunit 3 n=1 Tax=Sandarakinorhabdus sp. TaxID=1916663 RepID=UPI0028A80FB0|nr:cbb3-type cytochrome c oxidase subunit 3 [Sandarakinorhabdus sp.]